jgi:hypothetical protein
MQDLERLLNPRAVAPAWTFAPQPGCGRVRLDGDKFILVGRPGESPVHGLGHINLRTLCERGRPGGPAARPPSETAVKSIEAWAGVRDSCWSEEQEERFVRQFELYVGERVPVLSRWPAEPGEPLSADLRPVLEDVWPLEEVAERLKSASVASATDASGQPRQHVALDGEPPAEIASGLASEKQDHERAWA